MENERYDFSNGFLLNVAVFTLDGVDMARLTFTNGKSVQIPWSDFCLYGKAIAWFTLWSDKRVKEVVTK